MRAASVVLVLTFALVCGACGGKSNPAGADGGAADASFQHDASPHQDGPQDDGGVQRDAPTANYDTGTSLVQCGTAACSVAAVEECCVTSLTPHCVPKNTCAGYATFRCDGPEDCFNAAQPVCCGRNVYQGGTTNCEAAADCVQAERLRMCRGDGDCAGTDKCCGYVAVGAISFQFCMTEGTCPTTAADPGVPCAAGTTTCTTPEACCMTLTGGSCGTVASCTQGVPLECDGPEDCQQDGGTQVCCGNINFAGAITGSSSCAATCTPTGLLGGVLCHTDADCPGGQHCRTRGYNGYSLRLCQ